MLTPPEDVESLQRRLQLSEEWNLRLQSQIQELLRLSHSEVEAMRERMQNPDIAIPLLQCYDAAILEKQEENEKLQREMNKLKSMLEATTSELEEAREAMRVADMQLKQLRMQAQEERGCLEDAKLEMEREAAQARRELARSLDAEAALKREIEQLKQELSVIQSDATKFQRNTETLEEEAKHAQSRLKTIASEKEETLQHEELQRIQLQLLSKENEDKLQELERLRNRMVQALRQAADNHVAHLRVVEEKHREAVEGLRAQLTTQELEVQKLRAQLARVDANGRGGRYALKLRTTTELLETQTRQAQEMELKRLYGEISNLQLQRDDAVLRYEQLSSSLRREETDRLTEAQQETQLVRRKLRDQEQKYEQLDKENTRVKEELRVFREKCKGQTGDLQRARLERDQTLKKMEELRRALATSEEACERVHAEAKNDMAKERQRVRELEQRVDEVLRDMQASRDRANASTMAIERQRDELCRQLADLQERLKAVQTRLSARDREVEVLTAKAEHLQEAVRMNQKQALSCDERVQQLLAQDEEKSRQLREMTLMVERLKREGARVARARDRLIEELNIRL
ncbi:hypothetical protein TraAM80_09344 [Trypanosoma rangeli]|uniref:Uncharacterized protein n=1 Tax=Trypanosoma rangeli TaxID=5698 RepID=A0A422MW68_TRYRA|nr:uncharacterized protein TraAM80_09344 [Trypanosoma rangeli]RNE97401.1 hypothetical protein TraAM80_09344 [Trypanosoma rangeli]|eukprot:RNE97401.1 hypothetical protein TraAM80_09344 [Trypanosoma rangeli]